MPFDDSPLQHLEDILDNIARIERHVVGLDDEAFLIDEKTMDAVERCLHRISEAAIRLGPQGPALCPDIPWPNIRGIGNVLRHDYGNVNPRMIWKTVQESLPPLQMAVHLAVIRLEAREPESEAG